MRQYWWEPPHPPHLVSPNIFWCPPLFPVSPQPPSVSIQADGLPLTEHWHQMCSSSVDSGTSWAECASGSVNENGSAVHLCVCVCVYVCVLFTVVQWHVTVGGSLRGWGFFWEPQRVALQLNSAMQRSTAHPPWLKPYSYPSRINTHTLSLSLSTLYLAMWQSVIPSVELSLTTAPPKLPLIHNHIFFPLTYLAARGSLVLLLIHTHSSNKEVRVQTVWGWIYPAVIA